MKYARLLAEFYATPWAILPERLAVISAVLHRAADGARLSAEEIRSAIGDAPEAAAERRTRDASAPGSIAVLPLFGIVSHRIHQVQDISGPGGTSAEGFGKTLRLAVQDPNVAAIVLDIDSPGGSVYGVPELADEIHAARAKKKIVAVANSMAASAAYWIGSAATELMVTPSGEVGSIGVWTGHEDWSKNLEMKGIKVSLISAGKHKVEGNPYQPLDEEARAAIQQSVNDYYGMFVRAVAKHRGAKAADVRDGFGEGRLVRAAEAVSAGMADGVATLDETIARLLRETRRPNPGQSAALAARRLEIAEKV